MDALDRLVLSLILAVAALPFFFNGFFVAGWMLLITSWIIVPRTKKDEDDDG